MLFSWMIIVHWFLCHLSGLSFFMSWLQDVIKMGFDAFMFGPSVSITEIWCLLQWLTRRHAHLLRAQQGIPISEYGVSITGNMPSTLGIFQGFLFLLFTISWYYFPGETRLGTDAWAYEVKPLCTKNEISGLRRYN